MSLQDITARASEAPAAAEPTAELIARILKDYHVPHLRDLLEAIDLARRVEERHGGHAQAPVGLAALLGEIFEHLGVHQAREEAVLFPAMLAGARNLAGPLAVMDADHRDVGLQLGELERLTHGFEAPEEACGTWRRLYALCRQFHRDLQDHIRLEDEVLFPRFL